MKILNALFVSLLLIGVQNVEPRVKFGEWRCLMTAWRMGFEGFCIETHLCQSSSKWVRIGDHRLCPGIWPPLSCCYYSRWRRNPGPKPNKEDWMPDPVVPVVCSANAGKQDVFIMFDNSYHSTNAQFRKAKWVISQFIDAVPYSTSRTRIGLIVYNNNARILSRLDQYNTEGNLKRIVAEISRKGRHSRPSKALYILWRYGFRKHYGDRPGVQNVIIAFSNRAVFTSRFYRLLRRLKRAGTVMYTVAMNRGTSHAMRVTFPTSADNSFSLTQPGFDGHNLAASTCATVPTIPPMFAPFIQHRDRDVIIIIDNSVGVTQTASAKALAVELINALTIGDKQTRVGIVYDVTKINPMLNKGNTKAELKNIVNGIKPHSLEPRAEKSLAILLRRGFRVMYGDRATAKNRVVFLTNGKTRNPASAMLSAHRLRIKRKVVMFVVSLGAKPPSNFILKLVPKQHRFMLGAPGFTGEDLVGKIYM